MNRKVAVILSGCGVYDGSEIYESVITLLRLDQRGAKVQCFAPDIQQMHVINHLTGEEMSESRNVLTESARLRWAMHGGRPGRAPADARQARQWQAVSPANSRPD